MAGSRQVQDAAKAVLREAAARKAFHADLSKELGRFDDPDAIAEVTAARLRPHLGVLRCGFARADATGEVVTVEQDWTPGRVLGRGRPPPGQLRTLARGCSSAGKDRGGGRHDRRARIWSGEEAVFVRDVA